MNKLPDGGAPETFVMPMTSEAPSTIHAASPPAMPSGFVIPPTHRAIGKRRRVWPWLVGVAALLLLIGAFAVVASFVMYARKPLVHHLVLRAKYEGDNRDSLVTTAVEIIKARLNAIGVRKFEVKAGAPGSGQIFVDLPALEDPERVKQLISTWGKLEFVHVIGPASPAPAQTFPTKEAADAALKSNDKLNGRVLPFSERRDLGTGKWVIVEVPAIVDGFDLRNANAVRSPGGGADYEIQFSLKKDGANKFGSWTGSHINEYLGVALNDEVKSIAFIKSQIMDEGVISGRYTRQSAEDLALVLKAGALPIPLEFEEERIDKQ